MAKEQAVETKKEFKRSFFESPGYKKFMGYLYGWGASIVIIGALFKIQHYPGAGLMLMVGMGTEAIIFFFSVWDKPHAQYEWDRVYPALKNNADGSPMYEEGTAPSYALNGGGSVASGRTLDEAGEKMLSEKIDEMLATAKVSPEVFERLSTGVETLVKTSQSLGQLPEIVSVNKGYADQLNKMTEQMIALNSFYEAQINLSKTQAEASMKLQKDITQIMDTLSNSLDASMKYRQEIDELSGKVAALNKMYGNMLSAMQGAKA